MVLCKDEDFCPTCTRVYSERLSVDLRDVLFDIYSKIHRRMKYVAFEFTVARDLWGRIDDKCLSELRGEVVAVLNEVIGGGGRYLLGGVLSAHYWHSSNPFGGWYPHFHGLLLDLVFDRVTKSFVPISAFVGREQLATIRKRWRERLVRVLGETSAKDVDVRFHYSVGYGHLRHRTSYMFRSAAYDILKYVKVAAVPEDADSSWIRRAFVRPKKGKHVLYFGWFTQSVRQRYSWRLFGLKKCPSEYCGHEAHDGRCKVILQLGRCLCKGTRAIPSKGERERERKRVYCPSCGLVMEDTMESYSFDEIQSMGGMILKYVGDGWFGKFGGG